MFLIHERGIALLTPLFSLSDIPSSEVEQLRHRLDTAPRKSLHNAHRMAQLLCHLIPKLRFTASLSNSIIYHVFSLRTINLFALSRHPASCFILFRFHTATLLIISSSSNLFSIFFLRTLYSFIWSSGIHVSTESPQVLTTYSSTTIVLTPLFLKPPLLRRPAPRLSPETSGHTTPSYYRERTTILVALSSPTQDDDYGHSIW